MSKKILDLSESSDEEVPQINVNTDFAKNYDNWRRKEELQKLKDKYGDNLDILSDSGQSFVSGSGDGSDDSESESEESVGKDEQIFDDNFFKVYSALKSKNPIIYDKNFKFFNESKSEDNSEKEKKKNKEKTMTLLDYHKKLIKEKKGITEEDLQETNGPEDKSVGYYQELDQIKNEFKTIINSEPTDGDSDEELIKGKPQKESPKKEKRKIILDEEEVQKDSDLKYLRDYWNNEKQLEESERYLKDYIINKRYIDETEEKDEELYVKPNPYESKVSDDSSDDNEVNNGFETMDDINKNKDIDIKISDFHFEEPDSVALKRFPRNIETIRDTTTSDKRAIKRSEAKERKKREKEKELKRLRKLKKEELKQKLSKLQEISGNKSLNFNDLDLNMILDDDKEFDAEKYDQKMSALFGNDYYENDNSGAKPKFDYMPEIDDYQTQDIDNNIDLEPNETKSKSNKLTEKKKKKINKTMEEIGIFEDLIGGDLPTRYKYRTVESNDFGLTDEEILFSDDKELNKWCSLKKMSQYRDDNEERYDKNSYSMKANNLSLKKKILKTFFEKQFGEQPNEDNVSNLDTININNSNDDNNNKKKRKRRHKKPKFTIEVINDQNKDKTEDTIEVREENGETVPKNKKSNPNKRFKRHNKQRQNSDKSPYPGVTLNRLKAYGLSNRKIKKIKHKNNK